MGRKVKVAVTSDLEDGQGTTVELEGCVVALFNVGGTFYALDDTCTHVGGPLGEGTLDGECVECPWHGARFNVKTGEFLVGPKCSDVKSYPVTVEGKEVLVEID